MEVVLLDASWENDYTDFVKRVPCPLIFYSLSYKRFLESLLDCESRYWLAVDENRVIGVLPTMQKEGPWGTVVNSLPFYGSNGGVLAGSPEASGALMDRLQQCLAGTGVLSGTLIEHPHHPLWKGDVHEDLLDERVGQFTRLKPAIETAADLEAKIDGSARRNLRKAKRCGVRVAVENDAIEFLESTHRENMAAIGGNAKPADFFRLFADCFRPDSEYRIYVARRNGELVAALLLLYFQDTVEYFMPATQLSERVNQPMALILFEAMLEALSAGKRYWNWGGTWPSQEGVYRFKRKWGAEDHPYRYFVWLRDRSILKRLSTEIVQAYPGFYVVPFSALQT